MNEATEPVQSFDARDWAAAFCKQFPAMDEATMTAWFANALMRGYDQKAQEVKAEAAGADATKKPRFENTSCSQCGQEFGPGDSGFSHCSSHRNRG